MTKAWAPDVATQSVHGKVKARSPGPTATPAAGTEGKVATAAVYLAGDEATVGHGATRYS